MTTDTARGFTIIEVMLFLAITGALFAALMIGVNTGVTQQRYLDSVRSYKALLQNEYSEVVNTRNEDIEDWKCSGEDGVKQEGSRLPPRGTSRCVILGRAIQITGEGQKITTSSVTGYDTNGTDDDQGDIAAIKGYSPKLGGFDERSTELDWSTHLTPVPPRTGNPVSTALILILRSPSSGLIRVFTSPSSLGNTTDLSPLIDQANASEAAIVKNCIIGDSGLLPKQMISLDPRIASPDAVTTDGGENTECQGQ